MLKFRLFSLFFLISFNSNVVALEFQEIISNIAISTQRTSSFTETKTSFFLSEALISKGSLQFISPSTLFKKITFPVELNTKIIDDELSIISPTEPVRTTRLSNYPKLELSINAIRWMLSGNINALQNNFYITPKGTKQKWTVQLQAKDDELNQEIEHIRLSGSDKMIQQFVIKRSNGEIITTDFYDEN